MYSNQWYNPPEIPPPTKMHIRNIDYSLNNLYLKREYSKALPLALSQLEEEEKNDFGDGRENQLVDIAIRSALKLGDNELVGRLADKTVHKVRLTLTIQSQSDIIYSDSGLPMLD